MPRVLFWDTSALVKVYVNEQGTPNAVGALQRTPMTRSLLSEFVALEIRSALAKNFRTGILDKRGYAASLATFANQYSSDFTVLAVEERVRASAARLADKHRMLRLSALDVLHLATALDAFSTARPFGVVLACSDEGLADAARREGLDVYDPQTDPLSALLTKLQ